MLYFIEGVRSLNSTVRETAGLNGLVDRASIREMTNGPGGRPGILVRDELIKCQHRFEPAEQTWIKRFGFEGTWLGMWNDQAVTPSDLVRAKTIAGKSVELLDGNRWMIPMLRQWRSVDEPTAQDDETIADRAKIVFRCLMPTVLGQDAITGRMVPGNVVKSYREIWEQSCVIANDMLEKMQGVSVEVDTDLLDEYVGDVMAINYRIGLPEMTLLGLVDESMYAEILFASLDWDRLRDLVKKNLTNEQLSDSPTLDSNSGETPPTEESTIPTGQPSES